jgi:hypothetical protein
MHPIHGRDIASLIGQRVIQHITSIVNDAVSERLPVVQQPLADPRESVLDVDGSISFSLSCQGFGTESIAAALSQIIGGVAREVGRVMPLADLDGITFAQNYEQALMTLDRGDPALGVDTTRPRPYGLPVAKCVRVIRDGQLKEHIVFDALMAGGLLDDTEDLHDDAIHLLVNMLAQVAHTSLFEKRLEETPIALLGGTLGALHPAVASTPGMYYAARESAFALPGAGKRYRTLVLDSFQAARDAIFSAKARCVGSHDVDQLLAMACPAIASVLEHAAQWLGHRDGLPDQSTYSGSALVDDLKAFSLDDWLDLFGRDLRRIYAAEGEFCAANLFGLGRHVERLLWVFHIFPWPHPDGEMYVTVLNDSEQVVLDDPSRQAPH